MKILITTQPFADNIILDALQQKHEVKLNLTGQKYTQQQVNDLLEKENPDVVIAGTEKYGEKQFNLAPNLKMISRVGVGLDSIDTVEVTKRNILVENTPKIHAEPVSEFIIAQILDGLRGISRYNYNLSKINSEWKRVPKKSLTEAKVSIFGFGAVGQLVYSKIKALGGASLIYDPYSKLGMQSKLTPEKLVAISDVAVIAAPLTKETKGMFDERMLSLAKKDLILVNSARGGIVNEHALYNWLKANPEATAFLDIFEKEPYDGELRLLENAILTPHAAGSTIQARKDMEELACKNVFKALPKLEERNG